MFEINAEIPEATVATMDGEEIISHNLRDFFKDGVHILVGVPGAYTPICTRDHLPTLIDCADTLRQIGVKNICCMSDDNPWALDSWARTLPGHEKITFLCDGNRSFLKQTNMAGQENDLFLRGKYGRFYAVIVDNRIKRLRFEVSVLKTVCTRGDCIETDVRDLMNELKQSAA